MKMKIERLQQLLANILDVDPKSLDQATVFSEFEQWDSFAMLSVVALVTESTGKQLNIQDVEEIVTVSDLLALFDC